MREPKRAPATTLSRAPTGRILRFSQLKSLKGIDYHRTHVARLERDEKFPRRVKLGEAQQGAVGWWEDEIDAWLASRPRGTWVEPENAS